MKKNVFIRTLALALVVLTMATLTVSIAAAADTKKSFSDVPADHWAKTEIQFAVDNGIASGYADGTFKPDAAVTNAQFVTFLARAVYSSEIDKSAAPWYAGALKALNAHGILDGSYKYTSAAPSPVDFDKNLTGDVANKNINRYNAAAMVWNVLHEKGVELPKDRKFTYNLSDAKSIPMDYLNAVAYTWTFGIVDIQNNAFNGSSDITRAQACVMLYRLVQKLGGNITVAGPGTSAGTGATTGTATQPVTSSGDQHVLTNGKPITEDNVLEILEQIKKDYPYGTVYMPVASTPTTLPNGAKIWRITGKSYASDAIYGHARSEDGCNGWAAMCSDLIFGKFSNNKAHVLEDHTKIRPGDIMICRNAKTHKVLHHSIIVSKYGADTEEWNGQTIYGVYTSGSGAGTNIVSWPRSESIAAGVGGKFEAWDIAGGLEWVITTRYPD